MSDQILWVVSTGFAVMAMIGGIIARDRYILGLISKNHEGSMKAIQDSTRSLDNRISKVKDDYVRREDLNGHMARLDDSIQNLATEMHQSATQTNSRLDAILTNLANKN